MTEKSDICLLGLILLSSLFTGVSGAEVTDVFISSGESVSLSCNDALHQCSSTTWIYFNYTTSSAVEVFTGGIKKNNTERSERLSLTSDCSLNIYNTTQHDGGSYTCRQYVNGSHHGPDSDVNLHVLHASSSQTEIRGNTSVTLSCQLFSSTGLFFRVYNTELRCVLKHKNDIKTSVTYTVRFTESCKGWMCCLNCSICSGVRGLSNCGTVTTVCASFEYPLSSQSI
ncbi:hypothetical protein E1301_Tti022553 [Triplophysa tibetana]|uniref:Ig-like domain-containing protein n=1 Tax=Triplophysa tibetana TaxID=1572043 RepID=A0A5A9PJI8_9TELE|nr:hypothetical protein E1301_Tti022553 [Triplophysa tibetana]